MSFNDPIADMLTRIRNALRANKPRVKIKASGVCRGIAEVLKQEGYIVDYDSIEDDKQGILRIELKYSEVGEPIIREIKRTSKPGHRIYLPVGKLPVVLGGLGIAIISTSKGVMSDVNCRKQNVGGEVLCTLS